MTVYAHSVSGQPKAAWEPLGDHLDAVAALAARNAAAFGWDAVGGLLGRLHDVGKASAEFQAYIRAAGVARGPDHSTAGALVGARYGRLSRLLAYAVAGHHAGLADAEGLDRRLDPGRVIPGFDGWEGHAGPLPDLPALKPGWMPKPGEGWPGFGAAFLTRMLFSCLVDADFLATEAFLAAAEGRSVARGSQLRPGDLLPRLHAFEAGRTAAPSALNALRGAIKAHAVGKAGLPPGPFTLTVPTGGGKTLTSLAFALAHAACHGLRRVVYVVPYTAIIEQTAAVFRQALGADAVLEHHASFDWEDAGRHRGEGEAGDLARLRRAAENWDAPVVVTTSVQFFESLFANRTSRCRKLHNLARAVIVLDEAQSLPLRLLYPCLAALAELGRYGSTTVLCTATQPAVRRVEDALPGGLPLPPGRELAPDPPALFAQLRRQRVERLAEPVDDAAIAGRFAEQPRMLCIVNGRRHAWALFGRIRGQDGAVHLSTYMCPRHRGQVLDVVKARLKAGAPVRLVSTSLVEAGVDFDFTEVWREETGLDSVAQAAGRCNREGRLSGLGRVVVFRAADGTIPADLTLPADCAAGIMGRFDDPLAPDAIRAYFRDLYANRGAAFFDSATLDGTPYPILGGIADGADRWRYDFERIARAFRMIEDDMAPVVVPWTADDADQDAETLLKRVGAAGPTRDDLRALQRYAVPVPARQRGEWLAQGVVYPVHASLGTALLRFEDTSLYDVDTGLRVFDPAHRSSADNLM